MSPHPPRCGTPPSGAPGTPSTAWSCWAGACTSHHSHLQGHSETSSGLAFLTPSYSPCACQPPWPCCGNQLQLFRQMMADQHCKHRLTEHQPDSQTWLVNISNTAWQAVSSPLVTSGATSEAATGWELQLPQHALQRSTQTFSHWYPRCLAGTVYCLFVTKCLLTIGLLHLSLSPKRPPYLQPPTENLTIKKKYRKEEFAAKCVQAVGSSLFFSLIFFIFVLLIFFWAGRKLVPL